jgi:hypothetical protein
MNYILQGIYLSISVFSTYCIFTSSYLEFCNYNVGLFCCIDYFLHVCNINKLKFDMILHHLFALMIIYFFHKHNYPIIYDIDEKNNLIKNILSTEISTTFLIINNFIKNIKNSIIIKINQILFISTFFYFRIYNYLIYVVLSNNVNILIIKVSKNNYYKYLSYIGLHGLFILNIYWFFILLKKCIK